MMQLIALARQGDRAAEEKLFQYLRVRFHYIAKRRIGEKDAEDLAHDACVTVLQKYKSAMQIDCFEAWAYSILRNKIGNYMQGRAMRQVAVKIDEALGPSPTAVESDLDLRRRLMECLRELVRAYPRYARALNLLQQGYSTDEICSRLMVTPNHYYVILNRGRKMLKDCIESGRLLK